MDDGPTNFLLGKILFVTKQHKSFIKKKNLHTSKSLVMLFFYECTQSFSPSTLCDLGVSLAYVIFSKQCKTVITYPSIQRELVNTGQET